jgi:hypothetical protein
MAAVPVRADHVSLHDPARWQWPIDLTRYDRTPTLTPAESAALVALGWEVRRGRGHNLHRPEWAAIARLVQPLDDARRRVFTLTVALWMPSALFCMPAPPCSRRSGRGTQPPGSRPS